MGAKVPRKIKSEMKKLICKVCKIGSALPTKARLVKELHDIQLYSVFLILYFSRLIAECQHSLLVRCWFSLKHRLLWIQMYFKQYLEVLVTPRSLGADLYLEF